MLVVIGTYGCSRCTMIKNILKNRKIDFEYLDFNNLSQDKQKEYISFLEENNKLAFPLLIKDGKIVNLEEI